MPPTVPQSVAFQALLDQQQAAFAELMQRQFRAMAEQDFCEQLERFWKNFNDAYQMGLIHGTERANRRIENATDN